MKKIAIITAMLLVVPLVALATPVPDTGQTGDYTATFGEDSDYSTYQPSYTKLDENGDDLPDTATEWVMVRDNVTGLIWEVKTIGGVVHGHGNRYEWQEAMDIFIPAINAENFGGYYDWRLPTLNELSLISNMNTYNPCIDTDYFPNTVVSDSYGSSSVICNRYKFIDAW